MRPALKAGLLPVWRDRETVQIGIDPRRAVALTGMGQAVLVLGLLDGSRDREQVIAAASEQGIPAAVTERVLALLAAGGALDDFPAAAMSALSQDQRGRLAAELAAAALARGHSDAGAAALARRDAASVQVYGPGRVAVGIADILATSGVGRVTVCARVARPDLASSEMADSYLARERAGSQRAGSQRAGSQPAGSQPAGSQPAGSQRAGSEPAGGQPGRPVLADLAILVGYEPRELAAWLMRAGVAHLAVTAEEAIGVVGPLVRPGLTSCLRCLDLTRSGLDPAWPLILAQLAGRAAEPQACDAALAAAVAAQAAAQALAFVDRDRAARPAENGTLELVLPAWQWRRRTWWPHPGCTCRAALAEPPPGHGGTG